VTKTREWLISSTLSRESIDDSNKTWRKLAGDCDRKQVCLFLFQETHRR
jgi:hypothetical protein